MKITASVIEEFAKKMPKLVRLISISFHMKTLSDTYIIIPITTAFTNPFAE